MYSRNHLLQGDDKWMNTCITDHCFHSDVSHMQVYTHALQQLPASLPLLLRQHLHHFSQYYMMNINARLEGIANTEKKSISHIQGAVISCLMQEDALDHILKKYLMILWSLYEILNVPYLPFL